MSPRSTRSASGSRLARKRKGDESMRQVFDRAVHHAQLALSETVASARALLDVASIGVSGDPAENHPRLSEFAWALDQIAAALSGEAPLLRSAALTAILAAIDAEIRRWEIRSRTDQDARAVLRAFLGLREILWEIGVRPSEEKSERRSGTSRSQPRRAKGPNSDFADSRSSSTSAPRAARVQRIKIQG